jgi:hypothetical protein
MPYKSEKQRKFFNSSTGKKKIGAKKVAEYNATSKGASLPEYTGGPHDKACKSHKKSRS